MTLSWHVAYLRSIQPLRADIAVYNGTTSLHVCTTADATACTLTNPRCDRTVYEQSMSPAMPKQHELVVPSGPGQKLGSLNFVATLQDCRSPRTSPRGFARSGCSGSSTARRRELMD